MQTHRTRILYKSREMVRPENNDELVHTHEAFNYHWTVWRWTGIHPSPAVYSWAYTLYSLLINLGVTLFFPLTLMANLFFAINLQQLCENLTITVTDIVANLKFINVFFVREKLLSMKAILSRLDKRAELGCKEEREALRGAIRTSHNLFRVFVYIYTVGTTLSIIKVAVAHERKLLYPAWFYVDYKSSMLWFLLVNTYQLFGLIVQAIQDCANDSYPPAYLCVLAAHMEALSIRVRLIGLSKFEDSKRFEKGIMLEEENYRKLVDCIKDYLDLLNLHNIVQDAISNACLAQFLGTAFVQCTVGIHFLYVVDSKDLSAQILSIIFFTAVSLEMFLLCYFAQHMQTKSEDIQMAFYSCDWISQLPKFKKSILITLGRTQKPCTIRAGKYFSVDLPTFLLVMKYTYSVFTLVLRFR